MKTQNKLLASILLAAGIISSPIISYAADSKELEDLRAQIEELKQAVKVLDRKGEIVAEEAAAKKKETPIVKASEKGFGLQSADGQHEIKFRGLLQADGRVFAEGKDVTVKGASGASTAGYLDNTQDNNNTFLLRRIRPTIEGTVFGSYDFRFTPEFGDGKSQVIDAYLDARLAPSFNIRAGKFKPIVGLERLQSGADIKFIERSYVSSILPNRDVGISAYGDFLDKKISYAVGVYNGVVDGGDNTTSNDINGNKDVAVRIFTSPFKDNISPFQNLSFGLATTWGDVTAKTVDSVNGSVTELTSGYKTQGQSTFFSYIDSKVLRTGPTSTNNSPGSEWLVHSNGTRLRISPQASYYYGPFGLITEYVRETQDIAIGANNTNATKLHNDAWQIAASYLLTGEDASFKGVKPKRNFDLNSGGWGAWEVTARYDQFDIDDNAFSYGTVPGATATNAHWLYADPRTSASKARTITAGVNWYLNPEAKFSLNYAQTSFDGGGGDLKPFDGTIYSNEIQASSAAYPIADRKDEKVLLGRFQIAF